MLKLNLNYDFKEVKKLEFYRKNTNDESQQFIMIKWLLKLIKDLILKSNEEISYMNIRIKAL